MCLGKTARMVVWPALLLGAAWSAETPATTMEVEKLRALVAAAAQREARAPSVLAEVDGRSAEARTFARKLRTTRLTVDFSHTTVDDVLEFLRTHADLAIVVSAKARAAFARETPRISLRLRDLALADILDLLCTQLGEYRFSVRHGVLMLMRAEEYRPVTVLKVYDVRDITTPRRDFPGPRLSITSTDENAR